MYNFRGEIIQIRTGCKEGNSLDGVTISQYDQRSKAQNEKNRHSETDFDTVTCEEVATLIAESRKT